MIFKNFLTPNNPQKVPLIFFRFLAKTTKSRVENKNMAQNRKKLSPPI